MTASRQTTDVTRELTIDATREEVWRALSEPALMREWLAADVEVDVVDGGEGFVVSHEGEERAVHVERVEDSERLVFQWEREGVGETRVELALEEVAGGTRVVVTESDLPAATAQASALAWSSALTALAATVAMLLSLVLA